jgi:hypothetical protein
LINPGDSKTQTIEQQLAAAVELNSTQWLRRLAVLPWVKLAPNAPAPILKPY